MSGQTPTKTPLSFHSTFFVKNIAPCSLYYCTLYSIYIGVNIVRTSYVASSGKIIVLAWLPGLCCVEVTTSTRLVEDLFHSPNCSLVWCLGEVEYCANKVVLWRGGLVCSQIYFPKRIGFYWCLPWEDLLKRSWFQVLSWFSETFEEFQVTILWRCY